MADNNIQIRHEFNGHILTLATMGLLRYGKLINWDEHALMDKVMEAITMGGDMHLIAALNQSEALKLGIEHLGEFDEEEAKEHFHEVVTSTVGALLQEWGGTVGIAQMDAAMKERAKIVAMKSLHGNNIKFRQLDSFSGQAFVDDEANAELLEAVRKGKAAMIDADGDIEKQLEGVDVPEEIKDTLKAIGDTVKREQAKLKANADTKADEATAASLRKDKRLN